MLETSAWTRPKVLHNRCDASVEYHDLMKLIASSSSWWDKYLLQPFSRLSNDRRNRFFFFFFFTFTVVLHDSRTTGIPVSSNMHLLTNFHLDRKFLSTSIQTSCKRGQIYIIDSNNRSATVCWVVLVKGTPPVGLVAYSSAAHPSRSRSFAG